MESVKVKWLGVAAAVVIMGLAVRDWGMVIAPSDDAYVINTSANTSFASETRIFTWTAYMGGGRGRSYMQFSFDGLPDRSMVSEIKLMLYQYDAGGFVPIVNIYHVDDDSWDETTLTWNNRPLPVPTVNEQIISKDIGFGVGWVSFDLLNDAVWDYDADVADGNLSLLIKSTEKGDERHNFYSTDETEEGDYRPYLEITLIPEPGYYFVLVIGGVLLLLRRDYKLTH